MSFRAKCRITGVHSTNSLHKYPDGSLPIESMHVTLQPVFGGGNDDANKQWSKWTPSGELKLSITNPEIYPELVNGKVFYVDFTPAEE